MKFEADIIKALQESLPLGWLKFFLFVTEFGSLFGLLITFLIVFRRDKKFSVVLLISFVIAQVLNKVLKAMIARARPFESYDEIINYGGEDGYSMPSGHSLSIALFSTFIIYSSFRYRKNFNNRICSIVFSVIMCFLVGLSRMVLGVHYLTDVLCGLAEGVIVSSFLIWCYNFINFVIKLRRG